MAVDLNGVSSWAMAEFSEVNLGDARLNARLMLVADRLTSRPHESIPAAMNGWTKTQAAYRLFANGKATFERIHKPHAERTIERIAQHPVVLIVQDTSELDYTKKRQKNRSAGPLNWKERVGFLLHPSIAVTPEGLHLGTVRSHYGQRVDFKPPGSRARHGKTEELLYKMPIGSRKTEGFERTRRYAAVDQNDKYSSRSPHAPS